MRLNKSFCRLILDLVAQKAQIAQSIIASSEDINLLVQNDINSTEQKQLRIMKGWRYELIGRKLEDFFNGNIIISLEDGRMSMRNKL